MLMHIRGKETETVEDIDSRGLGKKMPDECQQEDQQEMNQWKSEQILLLSKATEQ